MKKVALITAILMVAMLRAYGVDTTEADPQTMASLTSMTTTDLESRGDILRAEREYAEAIRYYQ